MFGGVGEICVRSRAEAVDEVSFQDWKYAQERRGDERVCDFIFDMNNIFVSRHFTCYLILFIF